jgi:hypothetical protein
LFALLLLICAGCAEGERALTHSDASVQAGEPTGDADVDPAGRDAGKSASANPAVDLNFLLLATLLETERTLIARCPCLIVSGQYESMPECLSALSLGRSWIDCANQVDLRAHDSAATRDNLRCNVAELTQRTECLMGSACKEDAVAACMIQNLGCSLLPWELLSSVASECMIAFSR